MLILHQASQPGNIGNILTTIQTVFQTKHWTPPNLTVREKHGKMLVGLNFDDFLCLYNILYWTIGLFLLVNPSVTLVEPVSVGWGWRSQFDIWEWRLFRSRLVSPHGGAGISPPRYGSTWASRIQSPSWQGGTDQAKAGRAQCFNHPEILFTNNQSSTNTHPYSCLVSTSHDTAWHLLAEPRKIGSEVKILMLEIFSSITFLEQSLDISGYG